jgi:hypothetical protein
LLRVFCAQVANARTQAWSNPFSSINVGEFTQTSAEAKTAPSHFDRAKGLQKKRPSHANRLFAKLKEKDSRYFEAAREILPPKSGYRLKSDLKSRGVRVREVKDQSQAADAAILRDLEELLTKQVICGDPLEFNRVPQWLTISRSTI